MAAFDDFKYAESNEVERPKDSLVVIIPNGVNGVQELLTVLNKGLNLPHYFGFNWDALSDCLRDLGWITQRNVFLIHEDVPSLSGPDLANYLDVLDESVRSWKPKEDHQLVVVFPETCRAMPERMADQ